MSQDTLSQPEQHLGPTMRDREGLIISMHAFESRPPSKNNSDRSSHKSHASKGSRADVESEIIDWYADQPSEDEDMKPPPTPHNSSVQSPLPTSPSQSVLDRRPMAQLARAEKVESHWSDSSSEPGLEDDPHRTPASESYGRFQGFSSDDLLFQQNGYGNRQGPAGLSNHIASQLQRHSEPSLSAMRKEVRHIDEPLEPPDVLATIDELSSEQTFTSFQDSGRSTHPTSTQSSPQKSTSRNLLLPSNPFRNRMRTTQIGSWWDVQAPYDSQPSPTAHSHYDPQVQTAVPSPTAEENHENFELVTLQPTVYQPRSYNNDTSDNLSSSVQVNEGHRIPSYHADLEVVATDTRHSSVSPIAPAFEYVDGSSLPHITTDLSHNCPEVTVTKATPVTDSAHRHVSDHNYIPPVPPLPSPSAIPKPLSLNSKPSKPAPVASSSAANAFRQHSKEILRLLESDQISLATKSSEPETSGLPQRARAIRERTAQATRDSAHSGRSRTKHRSRVRRISDHLSQIQPTPPDLIYPLRPVNSHTSYYYADDILARQLGQVGGSRQPERREPYPDGSPLSSPGQVEKGQVADDGPPDGGAAAWFLACMAMLGTFTTWGLAWSFGIFAAYYKAILMPDESLSKLAWIGSMQLFLLFVLGYPIGLAIDRGYFRIFQISGAFFLVGGIFATSWCTKWWHFFIAQGIVTGLGMGLIFSSGVICLLDWFVLNAGKALAIATAGSCFGAMVYISMFIKLVFRLGFPLTMRAMGFLTLALLIPCVATARMRKSRKRVPGSTNTVASTERRSMMQRLASYAEPSYVLMTLGLFFAFWGTYFAVAYFPVYAIEILHLSGPTAASLLIVLSATNLFGRLIPGIVSDACIGPLNTIIPSCLLSAAFTIVWIWTTSEGSLFVVAAFYGLSSGGISALFSPVIQGFCLEDRETRACKTGFVFTIISIACLTGNPIGGALVKPEKGDQAYLGAQLFAGGSLVVAAVLLIFSRAARAGWGAVRV